MNISFRSDNLELNVYGSHKSLDGWSQISHRKRETTKIIQNQPKPNQKHGKIKQAYEKTPILAMWIKTLSQIPWSIFIGYNCPFSLFKKQINPQKRFPNKNDKGEKNKRKRKAITLSSFMVFFLNWPCGCHV